MSKLIKGYTHGGSVLKISFNDGKGNVIDFDMMEELQGVLDAQRGNSHLKLILFEGEGKHFSFGASVEEHKKEFAETMIRHFHKLFYTLRDLSIPSMARVSGQCLGGGLEVALMCDFIFADETAKLGQPEIILGVFPPPASLLLPMKIGYARAEELLITGRTFDAEEGRQIGLINAVYENREALEKATDEWITKYIIPKSASSLRYSVKATRVKFNHILTNFLPQLEHMYLNQLMQTKDASEGINSFLEKRKPEWADC